MALNKFPTHCTDCEEVMPAGHGRLAKVGGRWTVSHAPSARLNRAQFSDDDPHNSDDGYDAIKDGVRERWG